MSPNAILFDAKGHAISPVLISERISVFESSYSDAVKEIINDSKVLDKDGVAFIKCASRILSSFGMTRGGAFHGNSSEIFGSPSGSCDRKTSE